MNHTTAQKRTLTAKQMNAIGLLVQGQTDREVGEQVGVTRETVTRWRNDNPYFAAELNAQRSALWQGSHHRLRGLVNKAVDVLEQALESGDRRAAVEVLKAVGVYGNVGEPSYTEDPDLIMRERAKEWAAREVKKNTVGMGLEALILTEPLRAELTEQRYDELQETWEAERDN
jgi:hypothetical protein